MISFAFNFFLSIVLAIMPNQEAKPDTPLLATGSGKQTSVSADRLPKQPSPRIWVLQTQPDWKTFCESAQWDDESTINASKIDFGHDQIVVLRNVQHLNRMKLLKWTVDRKQNQVSLGIRETRSARPVAGHFYFVAIVIPKWIDRVTDGTVTITFLKEAGVN